MSFAAGSSEKVASEDEPGLKWDRCVADTILKTGAGLSLGVVFSLLLFKRRPWPVALGAGFGMGYAASNCQHDFKRVDSLYTRPVKPVKDVVPAQETSSAPSDSQEQSSSTADAKPKSD